MMSSLFPFSKSKSAQNEPGTAENDTNGNSNGQQFQQQSIKSTKTVYLKENLLSVIDPHNTLRLQMSSVVPAYFIPSHIDEELRLKNLRYFLSPSSTKEKLIFEVFENEKYHGVIKQWGKAEGVYLNRLTDRASYTFVNPSLDNRTIK
jgi:hypothetical protein